MNDADTLFKLHQTLEARGNYVALHLELEESPAKTSCENGHRRLIFQLIQLFRTIHP